LIEEVPLNGFAIDDVAISPDGKRVAFHGTEAAAPSPSVRILDRTTGRVVTVATPGDEIRITFDAAGERLFKQSDGLPTGIWDATTGAPLGTLPAAYEGSLFVDHGGSMLATFGDDGVWILDASTLEPVDHLPAIEVLNPDKRCQARDAAFSPDDRFLAVQTCDGVRLWALDVDDLIAIAKDNVTRPLTDEECQLYLGEETCPAL
jgi:hypothetical protein